MKTPLERFLRLADTSSDGCWLWRGALSYGGYGEFRIQGRTVGAHRWAYEHWREPIPTGLQIDHLCRVRACVNPAHLEVVTLAENIRRGIRPESQRTHCPRGHAYDAANTRIYRRRRYCRICGRPVWRRYRRALRLGLTELPSAG